MNSKEQLINYLKENYSPGQKWKEVGEMFDINPENARKIWLNYRIKNNINYSNSSDTKIKIEDYVLPRVTEYQEDIRNETGEIKIESSKQIEDLSDLEEHIDTNKWEITKYVQNYWNGKYQVKAWLQPKQLNEVKTLENIFSKTSNWKPIADKNRIVNKKWDTPSMLLLNLPDLHFDKRDINNSTIDENINKFNEVLEYLTAKAYHSSNIDLITFVVGNDIFNTDNFLGTTTMGTIQRNIETWDLAYEKVFECMRSAIGYLSTFAPVHIVLIQGNHDRTKSFFLAHALEAYFKNDPNITFDRTSKINKYIEYGSSFIGFNHGNNMNDKLPLAFATEYSSAWGSCKYHDIYIGDKHHNNEKVFKLKQTQNDGHQGVKLRILPSLSKPDDWHDDNLFRSRQSGIGVVYDYNRGKSAEFEYQL